LLLCGKARRARADAVLGGEMGQDKCNAKRAKPAAMPEGEARHRTAERPRGPELMLCLDGSPRGRLQRGGFLTAAKQAGQLAKLLVFGGAPRPAVDGLSRK
jgi:hypothetical protein